VSDPPRPDGQGDDVPGDTGAADIVGPTGEEMPVASHDEVEAPRRPPGPAPRRGNAVPTKGPSGNN
jgi:hypothetical protein